MEYIGDSRKLEADLQIHAAIAHVFGSYKLSLHSGSDKFLDYLNFARNNGDMGSARLDLLKWQ